MRAAIYARYSSDNQREQSIEDQLRLCREHAAREGWTVTRIFQDAAMSGASALRPGYQSLLEGARNRDFEVVVSEALDRLSRDQSDVAGLFKHLQFAGVQIVTLAEGLVSEMHVGLKGTMNALFLKDLAAKTHRGLRGRVEAGKSGGGLCFGYDVVRQLDARGEPIRGDRRIKPAQSAIVQRMFKMFAGGMSPIAIAKKLNAEQVPGPGGKAWRDTTIRGHAGRGTGILRNELYVGRLVWNRMHFVKDPTSGRRVSRMNDASRRVTHEVPELRIIDDAVWEAVQLRLGTIRAQSGADRPDRPNYWAQRRPKHLLTGKVFCGGCGGVMSNVGRDYLACAAARRQDRCDQRKSIRRHLLEDLILDALRTRLMDPALFAEFTAAFTAEWNRLQAEASAAGAGRQRELDRVRRQLDELVDAIAGGLRGSTLQRKLDALEERHETLEREIAASPAPVVRLHPNLAQTYRDKVARLHEALGKDGDGTEALALIRSLVSRITVSATDASKALGIGLEGELGAMIRLALDAENGRKRGLAAVDLDLFARSVKVVAGTHNHRQLILPGVAC
jgi:site-specific DNA recombinase